MRQFQVTDANFNFHCVLGQLWRNPEKRRLFEGDNHLLPLLVGNSAAAEAQRQSGYWEDYHDEFVVWAIRHLKLEDKVRVQLLDKRTNMDAVH